MLLPFLAASLSAVLPSYEVDCDRDLAWKITKCSGGEIRNLTCAENAENMARKIRQQFSPVHYGMFVVLVLEGPGGGRRP
jgi:hypothetical protein